MPNHCGGTKPNTGAVLNQAPTNIHVISSGTEDRIESADVVQRFLAETHVATRYVLGKFVIEHDLRWPSRGTVNALSNPVVLGRHQVGPAYPSDIEFHVRRSEIGKPVRVGIGIGIDVSDYFSACRAQSFVPCGTNTSIGRGDPLELWIPAHNIFGIIG